MYTKKVLHLVFGLLMACSLLLPGCGGSSGPTARHHSHSSTAHDYTESRDSSYAAGSASGVHGSREPVKSNSNRAVSDRAVSDGADSNRADSNRANGASCTDVVSDDKFAGGVARLFR